MKLLSILFAVSILVACSNEEPKVKKAVPEEELIEIKDGVFTQWYPGKKQIKFQGGQDENEQRNGIWTFYFENGTEASVTVYEHGKREGFTIVKHPNGALHYKGEYRNDKTVGLWITYDEKGNKVSEKDFGYPEE